jgi:hypothetical protein
MISSPILRSEEFTKGYFSKVTYKLQAKRSIFLQAGNCSAPLSKAGRSLQPYLFDLLFLQ